MSKSMYSTVSLEQFLEAGAIMEEDLPSDEQLSFASALAGLKNGKKVRARLILRKRIRELDEEARTLETEQGDAELWVETNLDIDECRRLLKELDG